MVKIIRTNQEKGCFWQEETAQEREISCMQLVSLFPEIRRQEIRGFGGAITESAAWCYGHLSQEQKRELLEACYGESGLRYRMGRTHVNSCDFSVSNYAAVTDAQDTAFETFTLAREEEWLLPLLRAAVKKTGGTLELLLSPWSPPAFMKTNGEMNHGGKLKPQYRQAWAEYLVKFIREYEKAGVRIDTLTVQNEPEAVQTWDSCVYTAQEERDFVRDHLGPTMEKAGLGHVGIFIWDHNKEAAYRRAKAVLDDADAARYVRGTAVHWYTGDHFRNLALIRERYPDKEIFFTEGCVEYSRFADSGEIPRAEMYAHDIIGNLNHGVSAFLDWNLILDAQGGPNHVGNYCAAPIMAKEDWSGFEKRLSYYYIGHFSRYIQPGARRIEHSEYSDDVETAAFWNPDGSKTVVLLNRRDRSREVNLGEDGTGVSLTLDAHSIVTVVMD